jgi:hypothetical protein
VGVYNGYFLCVPLFGEFVITRDHSPHIQQFLRDLAEGDGAVGPETNGTSGFRELAFVFPNEARFNANPIHPSTPGHFTCTPNTFEALPETLTLQINTTVTIDVLANDVTGGKELLLAVASEPTNGTTVVNDDGTVTYTPNPDFGGDDSFVYGLTDLNDGMEVATVSIIVNRPPEPLDDEAATAVDTPVDIDVLANDSDPDGNTLNVATVSDGTNGTAAANGDGTITYTPNEGFEGSDLITYEVDDGNGGTASADVTIVVGTENVNPVAEADAAETEEDTALIIDVLVNDSDPDDDPIHVESVEQPENGSVAITVDGMVEYTPEADLSGTETFTYTLADDRGGFAEGLVTVVVTPVNDAPIATDDSATTTSGVEVVVDVLANDTDVDGDALTVVSVTPAANGVATVTADGTLTYTPSAEFIGSESLTYIVQDPEGLTGEATILIEVVELNTPPVATDDTATTPRRVSVTIDVLANDTDPDGDDLTVVSVSQATNGTATLNADGTITYESSGGFSGEVVFDYTIADGRGGTATATVTVSVVR